MSIILEILKAMNNAKFNYKGVRVNGFGTPDFLRFNKSSFRSAICRLRQKGYISHEDECWIITELGINYIDKCENSLKQFESPFGKNCKRNLILIFDIPESKKVERDWLRWQLKKFQYKLIQRSVWVGPSPLPHDFKKYLKFIKLQQYIKTFKLSNPYIFKG